MKIDIKKLCDELGLSYEIEEDTQIIRCSYCSMYIMRSELKYDSIYYKTRISSKNKDKLCFFDAECVYNDDYNYNFLKNELIKTINKFKLEKIEKRKADLCKDF